MVEDEPRPSWNGSYTSSTSVCISSFTSKAILPQVPVTRPRKQPTSAMRSRTVCQEISGWPSFNSFINLAWHLSPSLPSEDSVPAAPPNSHQHARTQLLEALLVALEGAEQSRHLVAKGDRHRLLQI